MQCLAGLRPDRRKLKVEEGDESDCVDFSDEDGDGLVPELRCVRLWAAVQMALRV